MTTTYAFDHNGASDGSRPSYVLQRSSQRDFPNITGSNLGHVVDSCNSLRCMSHDGVPNSERRAEILRKRVKELNSQYNGIATFAFDEKSELVTCTAHC
jgi:hypothetical protein